MMFASEEDGDFSAGFGPSRLSNLFGVPSDDRYASNDSLSYTAPKQPRKQTILQSESADRKPGSAGPAAATAGASAVVIACAAHCYRLVNGQYASQGQVGVALLSNSNKSEYRILLYISQQKPVANATIHSNFSFAVQPNRYATIYDDLRQPFSLLFEDESKLANFAKEVAIAKANVTAAVAGGQLSLLVCQDLAIGSGDEVQNGDSVEARYTGSFFSSGAIGKEFDSNTRAEKPFRVRVGKASVIKGWDQGMLGMRQGGKRLLVIPPHLAYANAGVPDRIPPNSTLVFELELVKVKSSGQAAVGRSDAASVSSSTVADQLSGGAAGAAVVQPASIAQLPAVDAAQPLSNDAEQLRQRQSSFSEQPTPVQPQVPAAKSADKASLVNRMAKLGTAMLPMAGIPSHAGSNIHRSGADVTEVTLQEVHASAIPRPDIATAFPVEGSPHGLPTSGIGVLDQSLPSRGSTPAEVLGGIVPATAQYQAAAAPSGISGMFGVPHDGSFAGQHGLLYDGTMNVAAVLAARQQTMAATSALQTGGLTAAQMPMMGAPYGIVPGGTGLLQTGSWGDYSSLGRAAAPVTPTLRLPESVRIQSADTGNVSLIVQRMSEKIETLLSKVDSLQVALGAPQSVMETAAVVQNIRRIADDNDKLKKDLAEKTAKVESQNLKISELLQQNQRAVEQSNEMLEQRNDTYKATAAHAQTRVLLLEQEKVHMAEEISSLMSQLSQLQLQVASMKKKESELAKEVTAVNSAFKAAQDELTASNHQLSEKDIQLLDVSQKLKEEKRSRRDTEIKLTEITEEMNDLCISRDSLQKALNERKRMATEERLGAEAKAEESRLRHQEEISNLKALLQKQSSSSEQEALHVEQLNILWKRKLEDALEAERKRHRDDAASLRDESEQMKNEVATLKEAIQHLKQKASEVDRLRGEKAALATANDDLALQIQVRVNEMQQLSSEKFELAAKLNDKEREVTSLRLSDQKLSEEQMAIAATWKEKYDRLRQQASDMKNRYEEEILKLKNVVTEMEASLKQPRSSEHGSSPEPSMDKVKSVMNGVFQSFRKEVNSDKQYQGSEVMQLALAIIKRETLRLVETVADSDASSEDEDGSSGSEGDEHEEEVGSEEGNEEQSEQGDKDECQKEGEIKEDEQQRQNVTTESVLPVLDSSTRAAREGECEPGDAETALAKENVPSVKVEQGSASTKDITTGDPVKDTVIAHADGEQSAESRIISDEPAAAQPTGHPLARLRSSSDSEEEGPQPPSDDNIDSDIGSGADTFN